MGPSKQAGQRGKRLSEHPAVRAMKTFAGTTATKFNRKLISALLSKEDGSEDVELEFSFSVKIKTSIGAKVFKFETEKIVIPDDVSETVVKVDNYVAKTVTEIKKRMKEKSVPATTPGQSTPAPPESGPSATISRVTAPDRAGDAADVSPGRVPRPPAVLLTPKNKQRAPYNRDSGGNKRGRLEYSSEESSSDENNSTANVLLPPATRKSVQGRGRGRAGRGVGRGRGGRGGGGKGSTPLRPGFLDAKKKRKK
jgi:hypothetical protein